MTLTEAMVRCSRALLNRPSSAGLGPTLDRLVEGDPTHVLLLKSSLLTLPLLTVGSLGTVNSRNAYKKSSYPLPNDYLMFLKQFVSPKVK